MSRHWPNSLPDYKWPREAARKRVRRALGAILFYLSHLAGRFVSLLKTNKPTVLAIRTDGIGDAVLAEPMLRSLAQRFPDHEFHLWAPDATCELFRAAPYINRIQVIPRGYKQGNLLVFSSLAWRARLGFLLGRRGFVAAAYLSHSPEPLGNWLIASVRAVQRWYSPGDTENQFPAQRSAVEEIATWPLFTTSTRPHDLTRNAELAANWGADIERFTPTIYANEHALSFATEQSQSWRRVAARLGAQTVVGLMPAASLSVKRYPAAAWAQTTSLLWQNGIICALLGGPEDSMQLEEVARQLGSLPHLRLPRPLTLPESAALIGALDGLLSVDTGLAHIALAQEVPSVTLVGGGHPGRFLPWPLGRNGIALNHRMPCEGCRNRCHLPAAECITRIQPAEIAGAMARLLGRPVPLPLRAVG